MAKRYPNYIIFSVCVFLAAAPVRPAFNQTTNASELYTNTTNIKINVPPLTPAFIPFSQTKRVNDESYVHSAPIVLNGAHDIVISHKVIIGGEAPCIRLDNCYNIHITLNKLWHSKKVGLLLYNCRNIRVDHNFLYDVSTGVYAEKSKKGGIKVEYNQFLNMQGPFPRGQFVQFNAINGTGNSISYNKGENIFGKSYPEDAISLFKSNGTPNSPILIKGNWIRGGGPSKTGGGIMLGDNGGSYLIAIENILVDPGQYGIAISGGDHNSIIGNSIYARSQFFTNVGLYVAGFGVNCTNSTVAFNKVHYLNSKQFENNFWLGPNADKPRQWETNHWQAPINDAILPSKIISLK